MGWFSGEGGRHRVAVGVASDDRFDVRAFVVEDKLSSLFSIKVTAMSPNADVAFDSVVGKEAFFAIEPPDVGGRSRTWTGISSQLEQVRSLDAERGLSTYELTIVPELWLLTQRRNHRIFQQMSELAIVRKVLDEWSIEPVLEVDAARYKTRKYRVQYAESDFAFISRMLEDTGISYGFRDVEGATKLVLTDAPEGAPKRAAPLPFAENPGTHWIRDDLATKVRVGRRVRPGRYTVTDHDYRRPADYKLAASAAGGLDIEKKLERFHYVPGAFLFGSDRGDSTPAADDMGKTRTDETEAARIAAQRLAAKQADAFRLSFDTNALDIGAGTVLSFADHPHRDLGTDKKWLVIATRYSGDREWPMAVEAVRADAPYRPAVSTAKPRISGVESATVVGPRGEEIHTDEFGRVRVQFHWDREGGYDEKSSCWLHVSQPWSGTGFGAINLPRIGQEVLVDFLGGDPDRPVVTGRVHTHTEPVPYPLPQNKTQSGWRTQSSPATGGYNEIRFEDAAGKELMHVRAELDRTTLVNRDCTTDIGQDRTATVGRDDRETVMRNQRITVEGFREETVRAGITSTVLDDGRYYHTKHLYFSHAEDHLSESESSWTTTVGPAEPGSSTIFMTRDFIIIQAKDVFINPGDEALARARETGERPLTAEQIAANEARERAINEAAEKLTTELERQRNGGVHTTREEQIKRLRDREGNASHRMSDGVIYHSMHDLPPDQQVEAIRRVRTALEAQGKP